MLVKVLQNVSLHDNLLYGTKPTIWLIEGQAGWEEAYQKWISCPKGISFPFDSKEWKKGIFMFWAEIDDPELNYDSLYNKGITPISYKAKE